MSQNDRLVLDALKAADRPLGAYELLDLLKDAGMRAPPQVYRALNRLTASGHVHRVESMNAFLACAQSSHAHGDCIFMLCQDCGHAEELPAKSAIDQLAALAAASGFQIESSTLEVKGHCAQCRNRKTK